MTEAVDSGVSSRADPLCQLYYSFRVYCETLSTALHLTRHQNPQDFNHRLKFCTNFIGGLKQLCA